jgi:sec-independent protein translocase protein TatA
MHLGVQELLLIIVIIVLLFGARKLPELGRGLAQGLKEFKKASKSADEKAELNESSDAPKTDAKP